MSAISTFPVEPCGKCSCVTRRAPPRTDKRDSCKLPNVNPDDGIRHKAEPDHALRKYRDVDKGAPKFGCLGVQMVPIFPDAEQADELTSVISVGMAVTVQEKGEHEYIPQ